MFYLRYFFSLEGWGNLNFEAEGLTTTPKLLLGDYSFQNLSRLESGGCGVETRYGNPLKCWGNFQTRLDPMPGLNWNRPTFIEE